MTAFNSRRNLFAGLFALGTFTACALTGCGGTEVDLAGEGARRTGALPSTGQTSPVTYVALEKAADLSRPAPDKTPPVQREVRGGSRGAGPKKDEYEVVAVADGGTVAGTIRLSEKVVPMRIVVDKDMDACGKTEHPSERVVFDAETLGLANCLVRLVDIAKGKDWPESMRAKDRTATLDQKDCVYLPHIMVLRAKTQLLIDNSDRAVHNVHGYKGSYLNTAFNVSSPALSKGVESNEAYLADAAKYLVKCDIHPWMNACIFAVANPYYAVTDAKGQFSIEGIPPGTYQLEAWHESMSEEPVFSGTSIASYNYGSDWTQSVEVVVKAGETAQQDFTVPAPGK